MKGLFKEEPHFENCFNEFSKEFTSLLFLFHLSLSYASLSIRQNQAFARISSAATAKTATPMIFNIHNQYLNRYEKKRGLFKKTASTFFVLMKQGNNTI